MEVSNCDDLGNINARIAYDDLRDRTTLSAQRPARRKQV